MADFYVDDVISSDTYWGGISSRMLRAWLAENEGAQELTVRINSLGGDAFEGMAMYTALKRHPARIIVEVEGICASAASVAAMAGDTIRIHKGGQMMIHEASGYAYGPADALEARAQMLRTINVEGADIYAARTGQTQAKCLKMMAEETWMGADEAKALGFCDAIVPAKAKATNPTSQARMQVLMSGFKNVPDKMRERARPERQPPRQQMNVGRAPLGELARASARIGDR